ncbi:hypothetical protein RhiirB3_386802 [Rhizophagus irregularis]|nr:hypothetical protein RhiirB3_386802 [Rhizophagus irregularis]
MALKRINKIWFITRIYHLNIDNRRYMNLNFLLWTPVIFKKELHDLGCEPPSQIATNLLVSFYYSFYDIESLEMLINISLIFFFIDFNIGTLKAQNRFGNGFRKFFILTFLKEMITDIFDWTLDDLQINLSHLFHQVKSDKENKLSIQKLLA